MDENIVLKYRREFDCWVCDECDIENATTLNTCSICGASRTPASTILKAWSPDDEIPQPTPKTSTPKRDIKPSYTPPVKPRTSAPAPIFRAGPDEKYNPPEKSSGSNTAIIWLLALIIIFVFLIIFNLE